MQCSTLLDLGVESGHGFACEFKTIGHGICFLGVWLGATGGSILSLFWFNITIAEGLPEVGALPKLGQCHHEPPSVLTHFAIQQSNNPPPLVKGIISPPSAPKAALRSWIITNHIAVY